MNAHSTAVAIIDMELDFDEDVDEHGDGGGASEEVGQGGDVRALVRRLQAGHVWIRQQMTHLQRRLVTLQLDRQRRLYEGRDRLQRLLRNLQVIYGRNWGL
ncbi:uncharacterized protein LOC119560599 isoform X2 [Drosophila subpulchrella]|nr:uncharacterized protein LOC119560599 isoform X2 [Drosophila subpulchrella]XP_037730055.1 uncharacterized protein LOC119560599 isoform X2 [Drosophila subpulchrella]